MKRNKYSYIKVIQLDGRQYGYGWEDVCEYWDDEIKNARRDLKEYRLSGTGNYRLINRRVLN